MAVATVSVAAGGGAAWPRATPGIAVVSTARPKRAEVVMRMMVGSSDRHDTLPAGGSLLSEPKSPPLMSVLKLAGPGLVVAATGIGSGDVVSATVGGAKYGVVLLLNG